MSLTAKKQLIQLCRTVGINIPLWTQGAGGNISVKEENTLWIKATGCRLDEVSEDKGIAHVDYQKMAQVLLEEKWNESEAESNYAKLIRECTLLGPGLGMASMETGFHALLPKKYVLHFHSLASLLIYHELNKNKKRVMEWLENKTDVEFDFVEACRPGWVLSKKVKGNASIYFLESHGIILHSDSDSILSLWTSLEKEFCRDFNYSELYSLLDLPKSFNELFERFAMKSMPFKCYFPDVAVFSERLDKVLKKDSSGEYLFPRDLVKADRDMAELWLATQLMFHFSPDFKEVPKEISSVVKDLPTEKLRRERESVHG
jgi:hypothetical protein